MMTDYASVEARIIELKIKYRVKIRIISLFIFSPDIFQYLIRLKLKKRLS